MQSFIIFTFALVYLQSALSDNFLMCCVIFLCASVGAKMKKNTHTQTTINNITKAVFPMHECMS